MKRFKRKQKPYKILLRSKFFLLILLVLAIFSIRSSYEAYLTYNQSKMRLKNAQDGLERLEERARVVKDDLEYVRSGTGLEKEIRSRFDFAREGEKAIFIIEEDEVVKDPVIEKRGFWAKLEGLFRRDS